MRYDERRIRTNSQPNGCSKNITTQKEYQMDDTTQYSQSGRKLSNNMMMQKEKLHQKLGETGFAASLNKICRYCGAAEVFCTKTNFSSILYTNTEGFLHFFPHN